MKRFVVVLSIVSILCAFFVAQTYAIPKAGLILNYTFDSSTISGDKVKDLSGLGNDGTINGGGKAVDGAMQFDGKAVYVASPALDIRVAKKSYTAIGWFKTDTAKNGQLWMWGDNGVTGKSSGAEGPVGWRASSGNFAASFYSTAHQYAEAKQTYADNKLHCVAQVCNEDVGSLYVDGAKIATAIAGYVYAAKPFFLIGTRTKNSGNDIDDIEYFIGYIDQIAIYNIALGDKDIQDIASEVTAVNSSSKIAIAWGEIKR